MDEIARQCRNPSENVARSNAIINIGGLDAEVHDALPMRTGQCGQHVSAVDTDLPVTWCPLSQGLRQGFSGDKA